jgi:hypothetical protein
MVKIEMAAGYTSILQDINAQILRNERHLEFLNSAIEGLRRKESLLVPKLQMNPRNSRLLTESRSIQTALRLQMKSRDDVLALIKELQLEKEKIETRERMLEEQQVRNIPQPGAASAANGSASNVKPKRKPPVAPRAASAAEPGAAEPGAQGGRYRRTRSRRTRSRRTRSKRSKRTHRRRW